ncbi:hypothetical protein Fcan01_18417 [Folsomia candida]|uniref:Glycine N-acyltransferase-like protein n=1 Tax=Folsomia candida TaxID=158441 RepID=A0A226DMR4_FOLCA|nr:hypothetical protein Fcan01_18417 [Folsomia candida]
MDIFPFVQVSANQKDSKFSQILAVLLERLPKSCFDHGQNILISSPLRPQDAPFSPSEKAVLVKLLSPSVIFAWDEPHWFVGLDIPVGRLITEICVEEKGQVIEIQPDTLMYMDFRDEEVLPMSNNNANAAAPPQVPSWSLGLSDEEEDENNHDDGGLNVNGIIGTDTGDSDRDEDPIIQNILQDCQKEVEYGPDLLSIPAVRKNTFFHFYIKLGEFKLQSPVLQLSSTGEWAASISPELQPELLLSWQDGLSRLVQRLDITKFRFCFGLRPPKISNFIDTVNRKHSEFLIKSLNVSDGTEFISKSWKYSKPDVTNLSVERFLQENESGGVYLTGSDETPVSGIILHAFGLLSMLYTSEGERGKGLAKLAIKWASREMIKSDLFPASSIQSLNQASLRTHEKIGFKNAGSLYWIVYAPH